MKKFIAVSLIGIMTASAGAGALASPVIATGLTELIAEELIVDESQSLPTNLVRMNSFFTRDAEYEIYWCLIRERSLR